MSRSVPWGTDGVVSMPATVDPDVEYVDFDGFCFTPDGIRVNLPLAEREEIIAQGYGPQGVIHHADE